MERTPAIASIRPPRHPGVRRPAPSSRGARPRVRDDRGGHIFLVAGLLLAMGTVTLGGVVVHLNAMEEAGERQHRETLMDPVGRLLAGFERSLRATVTPGETNVSTFADRTAALEARLHGQAAKAGVYMEVDLDDTIDPALVADADRCPSYDTLRSRDGVVIGYDEETHRETIVGAIFSVHATDGRQAVRIPHYVKLFDCLPTHLTTSFRDIHIELGWATDEAGARATDDGNAAMTVGESPTGSVVVQRDLTLDGDTIDVNGWNGPQHILVDDVESAHHPATPLSDYLLAGMTDGGLADDTPITDLQIRVDAWHVDVTDDYLQLRALWQDQVLAVWPVATTEAEETFWFPLPVAPSGRPYWNASEVADLELEFQVIEVDKFDPPSFFHVEFAALRYNATVPERHAFAATFDWPVVPGLYDHHHLDLRYAYTASTPGEGFALQILSNGTWNTRLLLTDTAGGWAELTYELGADEIEDGVLELRLVDTVTDDRGGSDADALQIDLIALRSETDAS